LTINETLYGDTTVMACNSFMWHGTEYTSSTDEPTWTYNSVQGCDSIVTLHLTINETLYGDTTVMACNSFTWHGTEYTSSTDEPTWTYNSVQGCDSIVTLHLTINETLYGDTTVMACNSFTWHGIEYFESTNEPTYTYVSSQGCDSIVTLHLTIESQLYASAIAMPKAVCPGETTVLTVMALGGTGGYNYLWEPQDLIDGDNSLLEVTTMELTGPTTFTCIVMDDSGNSFECAVTVLVKPLPVAYMGEDQLIPYNTSATFHATDAGPEATYFWEPEAMIASGQGTTTATTVALTAMHQFYLTVTLKGCQNVHYVNVDVGNQLNASASADPSILCSGETTTLSAQASEGTGQYTFLWEPADLIDGDNQQPTVNTKSLADSQVFTCNVSDGNQTFPIEVPITVQQRPQVEIFPEGGANTICVGASINLQASPYDGQWNYLWSTGETTSSITVQPADPTTKYWVTVSSSIIESCEESTDITINTIILDAEIIGYQEVFNASDLWHGLYNYELVEHSGYDLGEVEWVCDNPDWIVTKIDNMHCVLWVKSVGTATLYAKPSSISGCDNELSIVINATEYVEEEIPEVQLFPNPSDSEVTIVAPNMLSVRVVNVYGQVVSEVLPHSHDTATFSVRGLANDVYLVEIVTPKERIVKRLVIAR
jgi:hypothetical protein